jgi:eukaryotic-like serine/threonine-protein kinase
MTPETVGPYRILEPLREGGVSSVYRAAAPGGATVALKVFSPQVVAEVESPAIIERFHREVRAVIPLKHPNILQVLETGSDGSHLYLATELFAGISLERLLAERRLSVPQAIDVLRGVCRGLAAAHARGFVHGHLTPRHILVTPDLTSVKVADFGPSELDVIADLETILRTGAYALASFHYLAPEQAQGSGASAGLDPRSDIYAAGAIFFELLTGRPPSSKFSLPSQANSDVPPSADVIVLKCLARNPDERFTSATALLAALDQLEEDLRVRLLTHLRGISRLLGPPGSPRRTLLIATAALLLATAAGAAWWLAH